MFESIVLGAVQGITEWLPISSEGFLVLIKVNFFRSSLSIDKLISYALFLHLGTFLAALIYFRKEVYLLVRALFRYKKADQESKKLLIFLVLATIVSGIVGLIILSLLGKFKDDFVLTGKGITFLIGLMLLVTAFLQFRKGKGGERKIADLRMGDSVILGVVQGFSILPGLSRSGLTVSTLLLKRFGNDTSLRLSFLMSLPAVLAGNVILNFNSFVFNVEHIISLIFSFLFGFLTIHLLSKTAQKINFSWFVLIFGLITILFVFL